MEISTVIGLIVGFCGLVAGYLYEGHFDFSLLGSLVQPSALMIIFGGTIGAVMISYPLSEVKKVPKLLKMVFTKRQYNEIGIIIELAELSEKARKDGLLSLEQDAQNNENELMRKGLSLVVDGIETEVIKDILGREMVLNESIFETGAKLFESAGGFAPTMGVIGTVMGMVSILKNLSRPDELGASISTAFVATLYGVSSANLLWIPFANKIKFIAEKEKMVCGMIIEGLLSIQAGENPRIIKEKLNLSLLRKANKDYNYEEKIAG